MSLGLLGDTPPEDGDPAFVVRKRIFELNGWLLSPSSWPTSLGLASLLA